MEGHGFDLTHINDLDSIFVQHPRKLKNLTLLQEYVNIVFPQHAQESQKK